MDPAEFEQLVTDALDSLPEEFREKLNNVSIVIEDFPTPYQQQKMHLRHGYQLFGLYEGVPQTHRTSNYSLIPPDKITIFQKPIEAFAASVEEIKTQVKKTVLHEIGHHFGMSVEELKKLKY